MPASPRHAPRRLAAACALLAAALALATDAPGLGDTGKQQPAVAVVPTRLPGNVFGGAECEFAVRVTARRASTGRVVWRLAAGTATVKAGEVGYAAADDAPAAVAVKVAVPPVKGGVVLHTTLTLSVVEDKQAKPAAALEHDVWVFPPDPFADRAVWLKGLNLTLYDPKGDTAKVLAAAKVPFEEARDVSAVSAVTEGLVVVGEGVSFVDEKGLDAALVRLAAAGRAVLVLAPAAGELAIPGIAGPGAAFEDLLFRREIVRRLDKRLDPGSWPPDGKAVASSLVVKGGEAAVGEVTAGAGGWPWVEARAAAGGRWALCGFGVVAKWDAGPTPRFLFARMLEHLTGPEAEQPKKENGR